MSLWLFALGLASAQEPQDNVQIDSEIPFEVFRWQGRQRGPTLCTAPCSLDLPTGEPVKLGFVAPGRPGATKVYRLQPGQRRDLTIKPGKTGLMATGAVLMGAGLLTVTTASIINSSGNSAGLALPIAGMGLTVAGLPFSLAGATKVKG